MLRRLIILPLAASGFSLAIARAQQPADVATRADLARSANRRAAASLRAGLPDSAWADVQRAAEIFPEQPAYTAALARLAARRGDAEMLESALDRLARGQTGAALLADSAVAGLARTAPSVANALTVLSRALEPRERSTARTILSDSTLWPEGLDVDPRDGTLYVTSVTARDVLVVPPGGATPRWLLGDRVERVGAVMGVAVDVARDRLWLVTTRHPAMREPAIPARRDAAPVLSELLLVRLGDAVVERRWTLGDGSVVPGELGVAPDGSVVVSDATGGRLLMLTNGAEALAELRHPLLRSPQGVAFSQDGATAWVADWSHGLLRWDRASGEISAVVIPGDVSSVGIDGLRRHGDALVAVQNGVLPARVLHLSLEADGRRARAVHVLDRPRAYEGEPTVGAVHDGRFVFVSSSQWPFFDDAGRRVGTAPLPSLVLREVVLPR